MTEGTTVHYTQPDGSKVAWHILAVRHEHAFIRWWVGGHGADCWHYGVKTVACLRALLKDGSARLTRTGGNGER